MSTNHPYPPIQGVLDHALRHAGSGRAVFPLHNAVPNADGGSSCSCKDADCAHPGKHPRTAHGFHDATTDETKIRQWWNRWPSANLGVAVGATAGLVVIDIDPRSGGDATLEALEKRHGALPVTISARTGGGGRHFFFAHPGGKVKSRAIAPGVDCKADNGYIVVAPSNHASGGAYEWIDGFDPWSCQPAAMPKWLLTLVASEPERATFDLSADNKLKPGGRNAGLTSIAGRLRNAGLCDGSLLVALAAENARLCDPPLDDAEVAQIAASISRYAACNIEPWTEPIPLSTASACPELPLEDVFPATLTKHAEFARGLAHEIQIAPDAVALLMLAVVSAAILKRFEVEAWSGWREPAPLWVLVLLPSGERKSSFFRRLTDPIAMWEREVAIVLRPQILMAKQKQQILERRLKAAQEAAVTPDAESERVVIHIAQELDDLKVERPPVRIATDVTSEALVTLLVENNERGFIASPEGDALDVLMGRYDDKARPNMGIWLKAYSGDRSRVRRSGRDDEFLERPALAVAMTVQPEAVRGMFANRDARGRGLLGRFLVATPPSWIGRRKIRPAGVDHGLEHEYQHALLHLLCLSRHPDSAQIVRLSASAEVLLTDLAAKVEGYLSDGGLLGSRKDWGAKLCGSVLRIALVLHCLQGASRRLTFTEPEALEISEEVMRAAIAWVPYLIAQEHRTVMSVGADLATRTAERILRWLAGGTAAEFTLRDCFTACRSAEIQAVEDMSDPINLLVSFGYIRPRQAGQGPRPPGRPASQVYDVNPRWDRHAGT